MVKVLEYEMGKGKIKCTSKMGLLRRLFELREIPHAGLNSNRMVVLRAKRQFFPFFLFQPRFLLPPYPIVCLAIPEKIRTCHWPIVCLAIPE